MAERLPAEPAGAATAGPSEAADAALVAAMRRDDRGALEAFHVRFAPLLARCLRAWGAPPEVADDVAGDVLTDVALALLRHTTPVPRSLAAYLLTALRHRLGARARARDASAGDDDGAEADAGGCSEHARRGAAGPAWAPPAAHPAVAALVAHLEAPLRDDERQLLAWLAHHVPLRTVATWLGVPYDTACKRAQRLRARLRRRAAAYVAARPPDERRQLDALLARGAAPDAPSPDAPPPPPDDVGADAARPHPSPHTESAP